MDNLVTDIFDWMATLPAVWTYVTLFAVAYGENVLPPIPGDLIIVFSGYLVGIGRLNFLVAVLLATLGGVLGFMTMYAIGHRMGKAVLDPCRFRWLPKGKVQQAQKSLVRWGYGLVAANRFLAGLRSVVSLTVGMAHMAPWKTAAYATLSAATWTVLIIVVGIKVGENWQVVSGYMRAYGWAVFAGVMVLVVVQVVYYLRRRKVTGEEDAL